ncbi:MAG: creatininase family protein [Candidatus Bathyarchaeia archaeon]
MVLPKKGKAILWDELSWKDIQQLTEKMKMAILPTASIEQHGPHLPLSVDTIDCYEVAKRVSAKTGVPVVPPLCYGSSGSHGDFPGTLSISPETMMRMIVEISGWLYKAGIRKIMILNGHMWNWGPIYCARDILREKFSDLQVRVQDWWSVTDSVLKKLVRDCPETRGWGGYIHANEAETACVLAVRPDLVEMDKAVNEGDHLTFFEYRSDRYTKSGVIGVAATKATAKFGEEILEEAATELAKLVEKGLKEELPSKTI